LYFAGAVYIRFGRWSVAVAHFVLKLQNRELMAAGRVVGGGAEEAVAAAEGVEVEAVE